MQLPVCCLPFAGLWLPAGAHVARGRPAGCLLPAALAYDDSLAYLPVWLSYRPAGCRPQPGSRNLFAKMSTELVDSKQTIAHTVVVDETNT